MWDSSKPFKNQTLTVARRDLVRLLYRLGVWRAISTGAHRYQTLYEVVLLEEARYRREDTK
jgi:hypothetical protein